MKDDAEDQASESHRSGEHLVTIYSPRGTPLAKGALQCVVADPPQGPTDTRRRTVLRLTIRPLPPADDPR